jgi:AcrR family transcriptional regulator
MPARETILDAAARVMHERGLAHATTKEIARAAGYSEALLYKHFADKQELFLAVLKERLPAVRLSPELAGTGELAENLARVVEQFLDFYVASYPIAASIFSAPELLRQHREVAQARGFGPQGPLLTVRGYLDAEQALGRIRTDADLDAVASIIVGAAFHRAFLAAFRGLDHVPDAAAIAAGVAATLMPALKP